MSTIAEDLLNGTGPTTIRGKDWTAKVPTAVAQDMKDGAALRRLREALPRGFGCQVTTGGDGDGVAVSAYNQYRWPDEPDGKPSDLVHGSGATIAEAADKCREALG